MQEMTAAEIKAVRAQLGLNQIQFAEALGISRRNVENWEAGSRPAPPLLRLAVAALVAGLEPWGQS